VQASELVQIQCSDYGQSSCLCSAVELPWSQYSVLNWFFMSYPLILHKHDNVPCKENQFTGR
jgi:hypothetical protein